MPLLSEETLQLFLMSPDWVDTGIVLSLGNTLEITATGVGDTYYGSVPIASSYTGNGFNGYAQAANQQTNTLIACVRPEGLVPFSPINDAFFVGSSLTVSDLEGRVWMVWNDTDNEVSNSGYFTVNLKRYGDADTGVIGEATWSVSKTEPNIVFDEKTNKEKEITVKILPGEFCEVDLLYKKGLCEGSDSLLLTAPFNGRWEAGLFYEQLPQKWSETEEAALHLSRYSSIIGRGLDAIEQSIDETRNYPFLQNYFYVNAFLECLGYENLPDYFEPSDLVLFAPRLLECHRLKGTLVPLEVITKFVFRDASSDFRYEILPPDSDNNLFIRISTPPVELESTEEEIQKFSEYIGRRVRGLIYVLKRFVPFWLDLSVLLEYVYSDSFRGFFYDDQNYDLTLEYADENYPVGQIVEIFPSIEITYTPRADNIKYAGSTDKVLNENSLNDFKLNSNEEVLGLFGDEDYTVEFI